jgi:hypothetical protein
VENFPIVQQAMFAGELRRRKSSRMRAFLQHPPVKRPQSHGGTAANVASAIAQKKAAAAENKRPVRGDNRSLPGIEIPKQIQPLEKSNLLGVARTNTEFATTLTRH